jgi:uncharacterized protein DUF4440
MKFARALFFLVSLFTVDSVCGAQVRPALGNQRVADRDAIRQHINRIFQAYIQGDTDTIRATHSQEWRGYITPSRMILRGIDQYMQAAESVQKSARMMGYKIIDFDVVFYGDVGVVPYIAQVDLNIGGARVTSKLRVLDVYAKLAGEWTQVASNTALHPDAQAASEENPFPLDPGQKQGLLAMREAVWRAWFSNDHSRLEKMIPEEAIAINANEENWEHRDEVLASAKTFAESGTRLKRLDFPKTEIQLYGRIAVLYSDYVYEIETNGKEETHSGRATEMFVNREGMWINVGWHLDSGR